MRLGKASGTNGATGEVRRGLIMKFLFKSAFWLTIVLILLPTGEKNDAQNSAQPQVSATQALGAASSAVDDLRDICTRKPDVCEVGSQVAMSLGQKAQAGAKMLYEFLSEKLAKPADVAARKGETGASADGSQNTLLPGDLSPAWRRPVRTEQVADRGT